MTEPHLGADLSSRSALASVSALRSEPQRLCSPGQQRGVPGRVGGRQPESLPGWLGQHLNPAQVVVLELAQ